MVEEPALLTPGNEPAHRGPPTEVTLPLRVQSFTLIKVNLKIP